MAIGATSVTLQSATDDDGIALPAGVYFFAIDGNNSQKEHIVATLSGTSLTGISSVSRQGVQASGVVRTHRVGSTVTLTDFAHIRYINDILRGATTLDATAPLSYDGVATISGNNQLATKVYVDGVAVAGASNANLTTKGILQSATQAQADAKTATGSTSAALAITPDVLRSSLLSDYVASDTGSANTYAIAPSPVFASYVAGQRYIFKAANANTAASTLNVNGLGTKTIKKNGILDLSPNDILAAQIVEVMYDGTNMILLSPVASNTIATGTVSPFAGPVVPTGYLLCDGTAVSRTTYANLLSVIAPAQTFTVTIASPAVVSATAHGLQVGDKIRLTTTSALPTGLAASTDYFVIAAGFGANSFEVSASRGGAAVNTSGSQSGIQTMRFSNWGVGDGSTTFNVPDMRGFIPYGQKTSDTNFDNLNVPTVYPGEKTHTLITAEMPSHTHTIPTGTSGAGSAAGLNVSGGTQTSGSTGSDGAHNNMPPYLAMQYVIKT